jgi:hypothetical protein
MHHKDVLYRNVDVIKQAYDAVSLWALSMKLWLL